ncbi:MAG TPA: helical backbone metal receptor [Fimbriimonadaceae bacterium]|nr:helical backbone metal receptor [Fimbriimonadaceae bacterium]
MRRHWLWILLAALFAFGCDKVERVGGTPPPKLFRSFISLSPSASELFSQYTDVKLVGRTVSCNWPPNVTQVPVVMRGVKPDYEAIQKIDADVVVYDKQLFSEADIEPIKTSGKEVFALDAKTLKDLRTQAVEFASFSMAELKMSEYMDLLDSAVDGAKAQVTGSDLKVSIILPGQGSEHMIAGTESFQADCLKQIGVKPVGPSGTNFVPLNAEWLISENPDVIIVADDPTPFVSDTRFKSLKAITGRHLFGIKGDVLLRAGSRVDKLIRSLGDLLAQAKEGN